MNLSDQYQETYLNKFTSEDPKPTVKFYKDKKKIKKNLNETILQNLICCVIEMSACRKRGTDMYNQPTKMCDDGPFFNLLILLTLLASLSVTTATIEHSLSTLKRITNLRNRKSEERLTCMSLMTLKIKILSPLPRSL